MLQIEFDMEKITQLISEQEQSLQDTSVDLIINDDAQNVNEVKSMIDKASKQIKENAKKRKEEQEANAANGFGITLDGKPDKFPFKSIKPKKAFLLGSPANDSQES